MKFHWGTGITIFIILFLAAAAVFITFAMRQEVSLVHEDYYERGVEHSSQMEVENRSEAFESSVLAEVEKDHLLIQVEREPAQTMDSARFKLYRPSDARLDLESDFQPGPNPLAIPVKDLASGRYILIFNWYTGGLAYEIQKTVIIP